MNKCKTCKRAIMNKKYLGMCPRCFANFIDILVIVLSFVAFPITQSILFGLFVTISLSFFKNYDGGEAFLILFLLFLLLLSVLVGLAWILLFAIRLIARNKKI